jgi:AcrR family transcriptional regulator
MSSDSHPVADGSRQLPRGRHKLPREIVADDQRRRLLTAAGVAVTEHGYTEMTIEHVVGRAGVSRTAFYEQFTSKGECVAAAQEQAFDRLSGELRRACEAKSEWPAKVVAAIAVAIDFAVRIPEEAQLLLPQVVAAEPALVERAMACNDFFAGLLRSGREQSPRAVALPELTEQALIGGCVSMIATKLLTCQADLLPALASPLVQLVLIPYLGHEEAGRRAETCAPSTI